MNWETLNWEILERLRRGFLDGTAANGVYWRDAEDLRHYDLTYAERIGWKWDAVLHELTVRGWTPPARTILDWGCGSGVAARRVIDVFGIDRFDRLTVWDHSDEARRFAADAARRRYPALAIDDTPDGTGPIGLLVISHVLNELSPETEATLLDLCRRAEAVLWVEPGTSAVGAALVRVREALRARFAIVAPCPHSGACGLLAPGRERDWCHFFAAPPPEVQADSDWVRFGQRAGIDLRSLPYAYLVLERTPGPAALPAPAARMLGRAEHFKGYVRFLGCDADGVEFLEMQKRDHPDLYKALKRDPGIPLYRWQRQGRRATAMEPLFPPARTPEAEERNGAEPASQ